MLLNEVLKCRPSTEPEGLIREDRAGISSLEHAYIMARDSAKEYDREDAEALIILAKKIIGSIGRLLGDELHGHPQAEG
jgi:HEPN domain-containing protein